MAAPVCATSGAVRHRRSRGRARARRSRRRGRTAARAACSCPGAPPSTRTSARPPGGMWTVSSSSARSNGLPSAAICTSRCPSSRRSKKSLTVALRMRQRCVSPSRIGMRGFSCPLISRSWVASRPCRPRLELPRLVPLGGLQDQHAVAHRRQRSPALGARPEDDGARHAAEHLVRAVSVRVRVVPVQPRSVVAGDVEPVVERLPRLDVQQDVVGVALGRDVEAVGMEVRRVGEPVDEPDRDLVAGVDHERRAGEAAVVDDRLPELPGHEHLLLVRLQRERQTAAAAVQPARLAEQAAPVHGSCRAVGQPVDSPGTERGAGRQVQEVPPRQHGRRDISALCRIPRHLPDPRRFETPGEIERFAPVMRSTRR